MLICSNADLNEMTLRATLIRKNHPIDRMECTMSTVPFDDAARDAALGARGGCWASSSALDGWMRMVRALGLRRTR